jgi:hypothetical protein
LLLSLVSSCLALQLQLCLVSFSPSKVGQFSFECCPLSHEISSGIQHLPHFGRLACYPTPAVSHCASPDLPWVLAAPLGGWHVTPLLLSTFAALPTFFHWKLALRVWVLAPLLFPGQVQRSTPTSAFHVRVQFTVSVFQFCWGGIQSAQGLWWILFLGSG